MSSPRLELRGVSKTYRNGGQPIDVLHDISLTAAAGTVTALLGRSGCGKTTLLNLAGAMDFPTGGEVLIDGIPLTTLGAQAYREQVGAVMQEDQLLSGSIADNICFFDPGYDQERMLECARLAGVHDEIMAMPMTYNSLIGDMGSSLSGGQKQRVLLARSTASPSCCSSTRAPPTSIPRGKPRCIAICATCRSPASTWRTARE